MQWNQVLQWVQQIQLSRSEAAPLPGTGAGWPGAGQAAQSSSASSTGSARCFFGTDAFVCDGDAPKDGDLALLRGLVRRVGGADDEAPAPLLTGAAAVAIGMVLQLPFSLEIVSAPLLLGDALNRCKEEVPESLGRLKEASAERRVGVGRSDGGGENGRSEAGLVRMSRGSANEAKRGKNQSSRRKSNSKASLISTVCAEGCLSQKSGAPEPCMTSTAAQPLIFSL